MYGNANQVREFILIAVNKQPNKELERFVSSFSCMEGAEEQRIGELLGVYLESQQFFITTEQTSACVFNHDQIKRGVPFKIVTRL